MIFADSTPVATTQVSTPTPLTSATTKLAGELNHLIDWIVATKLRDICTKLFSNLYSLEDFTSHNSCHNI